MELAFENAVALGVDAAHGVAVILERLLPDLAHGIEDTRPDLRLLRMERLDGRVVADG